VCVCVCVYIHIYVCVRGPRMAPSTVTTRKPVEKLQKRPTK